MPTAPFSGGEKSRLALALLVYRRPNLLLLDEPTNHLDLEMRQALSLALQEFAGAMMIVSHDRHLLRVTTDMLLLVHGGSAEEFDGSLDDYPAWLAARYRLDGKPGSNRQIATEGMAARKDRKRREASERQSLTRFNRRVEKAEAALAQAHARQKELEARLADSRLYETANRDALQAALAEQTDNNWRLAKAEAEWLEATEELERMQGAAQQKRAST
jgi:ATP-binding cassette subfamily F protein 3